MGREVSVLKEIDDSRVVVAKPIQHLSSSAQVRRCFKNQRYESHNIGQCDVCPPQSYSYTQY